MLSSKYGSCKTKCSMWKHNPANHLPNHPSSNRSKEVEVNL